MEGWGALPLMAHVFRPEKQAAPGVQHDKALRVGLGRSLQRRTPPPDAPRRQGVRWCLRVATRLISSNPETGATEKT